MKLDYANEAHTTIRVILDAGETLGHLIGPVVANVPTDPANVDYAAILREDHPVSPYAVPAEVAETPTEE